jgi:hypothetical protein
MTNPETVSQLDAGYRLPQPQSCPDDVYKIMLKCWNAEPFGRPTMKELLAFFTQEWNKAAGIVHTTSNTPTTADHYAEIRRPSNPPSSQDPQDLYN